MVEISNVTNYENEYMKSRLYAIMYVDDRITLINNPNNVGDTESPCLTKLLMSHHCVILFTFTQVIELLYIAFVHL